MPLVLRKLNVFSLCKKLLFDNTALKKHLESVHEKIRYQCDQCMKQFTTYDYLQSHKKSEHEGKRFQCEKCEKSFVQASNLRRHLDLHVLKENGTMGIELNHELEIERKEISKPKKYSILPKPKKGKWITCKKDSTTIETSDNKISEK